MKLRVVSNKEEEDAMIDDDFLNVQNRHGIQDNAPKSEAKKKKKKKK